MFQVSAKSPALVGIPGLPQLDQRRLLAQADREGFLKARLAEVPIGQLKEEHKGRL